MEGTLLSSENEGDMVESAESEEDEETEASDVDLQGADEREKLAGAKGGGERKHVAAEPVNSAGAHGSGFLEEAAVLGAGPTAAEASVLQLEVSAGPFPVPSVRENRKGAVPCSKLLCGTSHR